MKMCIRDRPEGAFVPKKEDVVPPCAVKTLPVQDGDVFDLGGVQIEAIAVPGHTAGTMVYLDRARRVLYSGDACNANTLLGLPCSTTVETYAKSLDHLATYLKGIDKFYGGHGLQDVPAYIVDEALILCEEILKDVYKRQGAYMHRAERSRLHAEDEDQRQSRHVPRPVSYTHLLQPFFMNFPYQNKSFPKTVAFSG